MKILHKNGSTPVTPEQTASLTHRTFAALVLTSILYLGAGMTLLESATASPRELSQSDVAELVKGRRDIADISDRTSISQNLRSNQLPSSITNAVLRDLSSQTGIPTEKLRVTNYSRQTWPNGCLGLPKSGEFCTQALVEGWRVAMSDGKQTWVYRTDTSGGTMRRENQAASVNLPKSVGDAVLQNVSQQSGLPISALRIVGFEPRGWNGGCIGGPAVDCGPVSEQGWQVTVEGSQQRWVYFTNKSGSMVALDKEASSIGEVSNSALPSSVKAAVLQDASRRLGFPVSAFGIVRSEQKKWSNTCLDINTDPRLLCGPVYSNGIPGWLVTVASGEQRLVYRTDESGSAVALAPAASQIGDAGTLKPTQIPTSQLPPPLQRNVIFRAISSGGFTGRTYQTTLMNDGRVLRGGVNPDGTTSAGSEISQISPQQVQKFQNLLEEQQLSEFHKLSYPAPRGAADYIGMTISSRFGTTSYVDMVQDRLPKPLQQVIQSWNQISTPTLLSTQIPTSQLPPRLQRNVIFRAIASGGIMGRTYQTTLMNDGRVQRVVVNLNGTTSAPQQIQQISPQQVQKFQQLLEEQQLSQFHKLSYPASSGAADYITVTLTSKHGTTRYADMVQDRLPEPLQQVIQSWNQIGTPASSSN